MNSLSLQSRADDIFGAEKAFSVSSGRVQRIEIKCVSQHALNLNRGFFGVARLNIALLLPDGIKRRAFLERSGSQQARLRYLAGGIPTEYPAGKL